MRFKDILPSVHIIESLNARTNFNWVNNGASLIGSGEIDGVKLTLTVSAITYKQYHGCNLSFTTEKEGIPVETFRNEFGLQSSKIIGAVVNGFNDKLDEFEFDYLCLVAKNNVEKRASLYFIIAERFAKSRQMYTKTISRGNDKIVLMVNHNVPLIVITELETQF